MAFVQTLPRAGLSAMAEQMPCGLRPMSRSSLVRTALEQCPRRRASAGRGLRERLVPVQVASQFSNADSGLPRVQRNGCFSAVHATKCACKLRLPGNQASLNSVGRKNKGKLRFWKKPLSPVNVLFRKPAQSTKGYPAWQRRSCGEDMRISHLRIHRPELSEFECEACELKRC